MKKSQAKQYNKIKQTVTFSNIILDLLIAVFIISSGVAGFFASRIYQATPSPLLQFYYFLIGFGTFFMIIKFPLSFYSGFVIEHRFSLSNQTFSKWIIEQLKGLIVGLILGAIIFTVFFLLLKNFPGLWWLGVWIFILIFSILLGRLAPTLIFPLFYKFQPLDNEDLKDRIHRLANQYKLTVRGIYQFDLSKNTKKANAAFTGLGRSKRVILGDTLLDKFSEEEIETVFAHELGHYINRHLIKGIIVNSIISLIGIYLVYHLYNLILSANNMIPHQLEALPYLGILFYLFGIITEPLGNFISRRFEYQADHFAVKATGKANAFRESLTKLSRLNLADDQPHPFIEFWFYSHPSIKHRVEKISGVSK